MNKFGGLPSFDFACCWNFGSRIWKLSSYVLHLHTYFVYNFHLFQ